MVKKIPDSPLHHKPSNRGYVRWTETIDGKKKRRTKYFSGDYRSREMWDDFDVWKRQQQGLDVADRLTADQSARRPPEQKTTTVRQLRDAFLYQLKIDRRDGKPEQTLADRAAVTHAARSLDLLAPYDKMSTDDFNARHFEELRNVEIRTGNSRKTINQKIQVITRAFRRGTHQEMVSGATFAVLSAWEKDYRLNDTNKNVPGPRTVHAAPLADVEKTIAAANPTLACMLTVQSYTGQRSANVCEMSYDRIDQTHYDEHGVWLYTPLNHKTKARGHTLDVPIGPTAIQAILDYERIRPDVGHPFLFNPAASRSFSFFAKQKQQQTPTPDGVALKILNRLKRGPAKTTDLQKIKRHFQNYIQFLRNIGYRIQWTQTGRHDRNHPSTFTLSGYEKPRRNVKDWQTVYADSKKTDLNPHFSTKTYNDAVQRVQRRIGVDRFTPHQLRHLHNERLVESEYGDSGAAAVLGHNSLEMTRNYSKSQNLPLAFQVQKQLG